MVSNNIGRYSVWVGLITFRSW